MKNITVNTAISKGNRMVNYPLFVIMIVGFGVTLYLMPILKTVWVFPVGLIATFSLMWLWWSIVITKWRIWAFSNVRNIRELKQKAINERLIWEDGSWFEKTEIRTAKQAKILKEIASKFELPDVPDFIEDDETLPFETKIYYSKIAKYFHLLGTIGIGGFGTSIVLGGDLFGYFLILLSAIHYFISVTKYADSKPQIILNEKGIHIIDFGFTSWKKVGNVVFRFERRGKTSKWFLDIDFGNWRKDICISNLNFSVEKIEIMIKIYRLRYRQRKTMKNR